MKKVIHIFGNILWVISGILMFFYWFTSMTHWLGFIGSIIALIAGPGAAVFPIVFWIVEGIFPLNYFIVWGIGIIGLIISTASSKD
jgi:hypothetical protein